MNCPICNNGFYHVDVGCSNGECGNFTERAYMRELGWNKLFSAMEYHRLSFNQWPGWDLNPDGEPSNVELDIIKGTGLSSRDMAIEFDDLADGSFWYRDWANSGIQFIGGGEGYKSIFVFKRKSDWLEFINLYHKEIGG